MPVVCRSRKTSFDGWWLEMGPMLEYRVSARRIDAHGSAATTTFERCLTVWVALCIERSETYRLLQGWLDGLASGWVLRK